MFQLFAYSLQSVSPAWGDKLWWALDNAQCTRDINLFCINLDERLNGSECLPDSYDMTFLTSGNKESSVQ